ncbi:hypothetical protein ACVI1L_001647 [Bradyrhizobium sp. USDA 4516]
MAYDLPSKHERGTSDDTGRGADEFRSRLAIVGGVTLSPYITIENSQHVADVLKAFGPRSRSDIEQIVMAVDWMAIRYSGATTKGLPMKFEHADKLLAQVEAHFEKALEAWQQAAMLHPAIHWSMINAVSPKERRTRERIGPTQPLRDALLGVQRLRDPKRYRIIYRQPAGQRSPEREFLWEPLFDLLDKFGIGARDFGKYQPLMTTVKALHRVVGIVPPAKDRFEQARRARIKRASETG